MMHGALKALRTHGPHSNHAPNRLVGLPAGTAAELKPLRVRNRCCSLIYKECPFLEGWAPSPAIPASASPSKPVRPRVVAKSIPSCPCASAPEWARLRWEPFRKLRVCKIQPLRVIIPFPARGNPHRRSPQSPPSSAGPPWAYPSGRCARTRWHRPPPCPQSPCRRRRTGRPDEGPPPP